MSTTPRFGTVEKFENGFWVVRFGPDLADIEHLRPWQFRLGFGIMPSSGMTVELRYISTAAPVPRWRLEPTRSGLWYAFPVPQ